MSNWYQRHGIGVPPQVPPTTVPQYAMGPDGRVVQINAPTQQVQQQAQYPVYPQQVPVGPQYPGNTAPPGKISASAGVGLWKGSRGAQTTITGCPRCGSNNYSSEITADSEAGGQSRKSLGRCFDCNYRPQRNEYNAQPNLQQLGSLRGVNMGDQVPVVSARNYEPPPLPKSYETAPGTGVPIFAHMGGG
jgi:hypothetical protein